MHNKGKYFTFPIGMLSDAPGDIKKFCESLINYAFYMHSKKLEHGTPLQKINDAGKYYGYTINNWRNVFDSGERIHLNNSKVVTSINKDTIEDFKSNYKTPFEITVFMAFCGLRSIIGKKPYCKTENTFLLSRMAGLDRKVSIHELPETVRPYANEYQMRKIKNELVNHWGLKYYSRYTRGFYVSFTMPMDELVLQAEKRRKKYLEKSKTEDQKEAIKKAMLKLYSSRP